RAIAREPKLLLLDEPLSNLDAKLRSTMRAELRKLHDRIGATSIFVTHDQMEAMSLADRIVIVNEGRLEQYGAPAEVYGHPKTLFVAGFLGAPPMNLFPGRIQRDPLRFECCEGVAIPLPPDLAHAPQDKRLVLGIRPEDVSVVHSDQSEGALQAHVEHVENLGAILHLHCSVAERQITVASRDHPDVRRGAEISLSVDATRIGLFDADSGQAVEHC
ncbi:MAG: TOBE domain-containing protein, partial [Pseudomonadota bacterium]